MNLLIPLFSPATGTWGGLTRAVAVAHAAEAAGHRVAFCTSGYLAGNLRARGYHVYAMPAASLLGLPRWLARPVSRYAARLATDTLWGQPLGSIWEVLNHSGVLSRRYLPRLVEAELRAAHDYGADALFTDLDPGAFIIARLLNLPVATAYASPMAAGSGSRAWRLADRAFAPLLAQCGLPPQNPDELFFGPDVLKLVPSIPELDGADAARADIRYVGPLLGAIEPGYPGDCVTEPGRRYVFCYLGSGSIERSAIERVLPQVFAGGSRICIVSGYNEASGERAGNVRYCPYVDARTILSQCDWTICHGGQSTVIQSLQAGVPLLIFPGNNAERRFNAQRVQAQGAGFLGEEHDWNPTWLRERLDATGPATQAARLGAALSALGGAPVAVQAIEEWLRRAVWRREDGAFDERPQ